MSMRAHTHRLSILACFWLAFVACQSDQPRSPEHIARVSSTRSMTHAEAIIGTRAWSRSTLTTRPATRLARRTSATTSAEATVKLRLRRGGSTRQPGGENPFAQRRSSPVNGGGAGAERAVIASADQGLGYVMKASRSGFSTQGRGARGFLEAVESPRGPRPAPPVLALTSTPEGLPSLRRAYRGSRAFPPDMYGQSVRRFLRRAYNDERQQSRGVLPQASSRQAPKSCQPYGALATFTTSAALERTVALLEAGIQKTQSSS